MKHYTSICIFILGSISATVQRGEAQGRAAIPDSLIVHRVNAREELQRLLNEDSEAQKAGDSVGRTKILQELVSLLNDRGDAVLAMARAYSVLRDSAKAFEWLNRYAQLGLQNEAICQGQDRKFLWLKESTRFKAICEVLEKNAQPYSAASAVLHFPEGGYLPEDIDYDRRTRTFLFTSVLKHRVFRLTWEGQCREFAVSPSDWPMMALKIDSQRGLVWATEVALPGFGGLPDTMRGRSALICYDLHSGRLKERFEAPKGPDGAKGSDGVQWGDMTLDRDGNPIVSDGSSGLILRLVKGQWRRLDKGDFIAPQTAALVDEGKGLLVPDYERGLAVMEIESGAVQWIRCDPAHPCALSGIDGVYAVGHRLLITQNGVDPERVLEIDLDIEYKKVTGHSVIERASSELGEPTHGVVIDNDFYFIANSGWDAMDPHGNIKTGSQMGRPVLMKYRLAGALPPK